MKTKKEKGRPARPIALAKSRQVRVEHRTYQRLRMVAFALGRSIPGCAEEAVAAWTNSQAAKLAMRSNSEAESLGFAFKGDQ